MSLLKIVLLVAGGGVVLYALLLTYTLWPTVRDVSANPALRPLLHRPLLTQRPANLFRSEKGGYRFRENVLLEQDEYLGPKLAALPTGTPLLLQQFKRYTNSVSGFTTLFALGQVTLPAGDTINFEYSWGSIDPDQFTDVHTVLPPAVPLWQARP